jgi:hypothetical protein
MNEVYNEYIKMIERMNELYNEFIKSNEKMNQINKQHFEDMQRMNQQWLNLFWRLFIIGQQQQPQE